MIKMEDAMQLELLKKAQEGWRVINKVNKEISNFKAKKNEAIEKIEEKIRDYEFRKEREKEVFEDEIEKAYNTFSLFDFIRDKRENKTNPKDYIKEDEIIECIKDEKHIKIYVIIHENQSYRKANYTLQFVLFSDLSNIISIFRGYNSSYHIDLRNSKTREYLEKYYKNNKSKLFNYLDTNIKEIEKKSLEYENALILYNNKDWNIAYLERQRLKLEKSRHSWEYDEYKEIVSTLLKLSHKKKYVQEYKKILLNELGEEA